MRNRQEIEKTFKTIVVDTGNADYSRLLIELLLDIRELLTDEKEERFLEKVSQARKKVEEQRVSMREGDRYASNENR